MADLPFPRATPPSPQATVLVVENERDLANLYARWLRDSYAVRTAYSGSEALDRLDEVVDVVLLDRRMPGLSGEEVLAEIRDRGLDCRVVIVSAVEPDFDVIGMGFDDYFTKPVEKAELRAAVERMLSRASYDETLQELFRSVAAKATLEAEKSDRELRRSDEYATLAARVEELYAAVDATVEEFAEDDFEAVFRDLESADAAPEVGEKRADASSEERAEAPPEERRRVSPTPSRELERIRGKYRALLRAVPDPVVVVATDSDEIVEGNRRAVELLGDGETELVGTRWTTLRSSDGADRRENDVADRRENDVADRREGEEGDRREDGETSVVSLETRAGTRLRVDVSERTVEGDDPTLVVRVLRDVTERRATRLRRERLIERLELIASVLSHDLRNPLSIAKGYVKLAREAEDVSKLPPATDALGRMNAMIDDVTTLARKGYDVEDDVVVLEDLATRCWGRVSAAEAALRIEESTTIRADPDQLADVFENLFRNIVERGAPDVTVSVGLVEEGFYVEDDGPATTDAEREAMFDPGSATADGGTGLGPTIVAAIVDAHGWGLAVTDSPKGGTRFEITGVDVERA